MRQTVPLLAFNRGIVSPLALARTDLQRLALSAETMTNWMPRVLGSMMLRPGTQYIGSSYNNSVARFLPFVFAIDDTALIELTDSLMRVWVDDELVTRPSVSTTVTNGDFSSLTGWTDADESGATSTLVGNLLLLAGDSTGTAAAIRYQTVTVAAGDQGVVHALKIVIPHDNSSDVFTPVTLKVGSTVGGDEYITETELEPGEHSLAFTPTGNFTIQLSSRAPYGAYIDSCEIAAAGTMEIATPWAEDDLESVRFDQSGDILFIASGGTRQRKIERRGTESWSVVEYLSNDGPFRTVNTTTVTLTPSALSGATQLSSSAPLFRSSHRGALFKVNSVGQKVTASVTAQNTFTNSIRVTGVESSRIFTVIRSGTWIATVTLQRSLDDPDAGPWEDVTTYTTNDTVTYDDGLDNQIAYYRIGVKTGDFTSGTVGLELNYASGSKTGICRVLSVPSSQIATVAVLQDFGNTTASEDWSEGSWSNFRGWPSSVAFVEGRLGWAGKDKVDLSVSDAFYSFDEDVEGDSGPISRTIGSGPVDTINWMLALQRLILGGEGTEHVCKASSLDEPMTPTDFSIRSSSTNGSAPVQALRIDKRGVYVQRGGTKLMELAFDPQDYEYGSTDLMVIAPELGEAGITRIAVQRKPDTRIHCVRGDGTVAVIVYDRAENVTCWLEVETDGTVEDVVVLPGDSSSVEDQVYYLVNRTIGGVTKRYLEKWALESQCQGATLNRQADSFIVYSGVAAASISGLSHLEGENVVAWGNGKDLGTYTVSSGAILLSESVTSVVVGLPYTAQWKSTKLAYTAQGTSLTQRKRIPQLGVILYDTHYQGLQYGPDFTTMDDLPLMSQGAAQAFDTVHATFDEDTFEFPGEWSTDSRLCLQAQAPRPCTILAAIIATESHGKS
jgi:hypothetical protein